MTEDRHMVVQPGQTVITKWIDINSCVLGSRERMDFASIERAGRRLLQLDQGQTFPPINGCWEKERFVVYDGRHEYLASLALGRTHLLVCWLTEDCGGLS